MRDWLLFNLGWWGMAAVSQTKEPFTALFIAALVVTCFTLIVFLWRPHA